MDPELASEMVKLLGQELKVVRAQLREAEKRTSATPPTGGPSNRLTHEEAEALIAENDILKADNAALQEMVGNLQDKLRSVSSIKLEDYGGVPIPHTASDFTKLLAENDDLIREKVAEEASRNKEKLTALRGKYKLAKGKVHEYTEILDELRVALSNCTQELEQSRKTTVSEIDFREFLGDIPYEPVEGQSELSGITPYYARHHTKLPKDVMVVCNGPYFLKCNEVIWSPFGIALGLVIKPTFQYNPKMHGGAWTKFKDNFEIDKAVDVCYLSSKGSCYLGTYERVGDTMVIAPETLKYLDHGKLDFVAKCTTLFPDLVPPSQTQMIINMYKQGVIKLQCFGIRCVSFNYTFAEKLQEMNKSSTRNTSGNISTSGRDVQKRKRDPEPAVHSNKNKRKHCTFTQLYLRSTKLMSQPFCESCL